MVIVVPIGKANNMHDKTVHIGDHETIIDSGIICADTIEQWYT